MALSTSIITCTGDRKSCFRLCKDYVARMRTWDDDEWIVVDDGVQETAREFADVYIRRENNPDPIASFVGNMRAAIEAAAGDVLVFAEDDDWYAADHVDRIVQAIDDGASIVGSEIHFIYHVPTMSWRRLRAGHAALCTTGIARSCVAALNVGLDRCEQRNTPFLDAIVWQGLPNESKHLYRSVDVVGMKGMPGRGGITSHQHGAQYYDDGGGHVLRRVVGEFDAMKYLEISERHKAIQKRAATLGWSA